MGFFKKTPFIVAATFTVSVFVLSSCDRTRVQKGYEYFPDMAHSLAYETYMPAKAMKNGITMQLPVVGTVPRGIIPYQFPATPEGRLQAGKELVSPFDANVANLKLGKEKYTIFCEGCHGTAGDGKGHLFTSGKFSVPPASLVSERMMAAPIGEVYHVITAGFNTMGAHGSQIRPDDRWMIALYVKNAIQKNPK